MSRITRSLMAASLATPLLLVTAYTGPTHAVPQDGPAAAAAGDYIVSQLVDGGHVAGDTGGSTADVVLALTAVGGHDAEVDAATDWLEGQAATFAVGNGPAAGKLAIVAAATGRDARDFGGVDLVTQIESQIQPSGQCGGFGFAFGQALCILGLERAGAEVPQTAVDFLVTFQDDAGAFGFDSGGSFTADGDSSGLALAALAGVVDQDGARASAVAVRGYLGTAQEDPGYWPGFSPVNTTGVVGPAMLLVGVDVSAATAWLVGQQQDDGGLPNVLDGTSSDLLATTQGAMLLGGESLLSVGDGGTDYVDLGDDTTPTDPTGPSEPTETTDPTDPDDTSGGGGSGGGPTAGPLPTGPIVDTDLLAPASGNGPAAPAPTALFAAAAGLLVIGGLALTLARGRRES